MKRSILILLIFALVINLLPFAAAYDAESYDKVVADTTDFRDELVDDVHYFPDAESPKGPDGSEFNESRVIVKLRAPETGGVSTLSIDNVASNDSNLSFFRNMGIDAIETEKLMSVSTAQSSEGTNLRTAKATKEDLILLTLANSGKEGVLDTIEKLEAIPEVEYAEPDYIVSIDATTPNDPSFSSLYGLNKINAPDAWDITKGSSEIVVAVIDTGIDYTHPDLAANIWVNPNPGASGFEDDIHGWNFVSNNNNIMDDNLHGTHVSGTIGGIGNNRTGVAGVCWNVKLMGLKALNSAGSGYTSDIIKAVNYADKMGAHISNNSYGGTYYSQAFKDAISNSRHLFVAAAGNSAVNADYYSYYPANYSCSNIIAVASTTETDTKSSFSNYGANTVHVAAPGSNIYSTLPNNSYGTYSGTSMASPHVAGAAALILSTDLSLSVLEIKDRLMINRDYIPSLDGSVMCSGRINVFKALSPAKHIPIENIRMSATDINIQVFDTHGLSVSISPINTTQKQIVWTSSNSSIATVTNEGTIKGIRAGRVTIRATSIYNAEVTAECVVEVSPADSDTYFAGGDGTPENPHQVSTPEQLNNVRRFLNRNFVQINDIDMGPSTSEGGKYYNNGRGWAAIGTSSSNDQFTGSYDGQGYSIINLNADAKGVPNSYAGLFGINYLGMIQDIHIRGGVIKNGKYTGGVIARNAGNIMNCSNTAHILIDKGVKATAIGGVTGVTDANSAIMSNCNNSGKVEFLGCNAVNMGTYTGGVSGLNGAGLMVNCKNSGSVVVKPSEYAPLNVGGVVGVSGLYSASINNVLMQNCYNSGEVYLAGAWHESRDYTMGGVAGKIMHSGGRVWDSRALEAERLYNTGNVTAYNTYGAFGGIVGSCTYSKILNCYNKGTVTSTWDVLKSYSQGHGGIVGSNEYSTVEKAYNVGTIVSPSAYSGSIVGWGRANYSEVLNTYYLIVGTGDKRGIGNGNNGKGKVESKYIYDMTDKNTYTSWDFDKTWDIKWNINNGYPYFKPDTGFIIYTTKNTMLNNILCGTAFEDLELPDKVSVVAVNGAKAELPVTWNSDTYNPQKLGLQAITGTLSLTSPYYDYVSNPYDNVPQAMLFSVEKPEIVSIKTNGSDKITEISYTTNQSAYVYVVFYQANGIVDIKFWPVAENGEINDSIAIPTNANQIKVMLWDQNGNMTPLCIVKTLDKTGNTWPLESQEI